MKIAIGYYFLWKKILYEIIEINALHIVMRKKDDGKIFKITEEKFNKEYKNNFIVPYSIDKEAFSIDLNTLDSNTRDKAIRIKQYLSSFLYLYNGKTDEIENIIKKVATDIKDENPPSLATLYNWKNKYFINDKIDFSRIISQQIRVSRIDEEVEFLIKDCVNDYYLKKDKISIRQLHRIISNKIYQKNITQDKHLNEPSYETVRKYVNLIDKKTLVSKRDGPLEALKQYKTYKLGLNADRILEYVEIDHVFLDIEVNYNDVILGRPILTLLIDNCSLSILGLYIGFHKPNTYSVVNAIKSAILPKEKINDLIENSNSSWFQFGFIENLITDNGKEFHSNDFKSICFELGINIQYAPPYHPWYKRYVENHFGVLNKKLISILPGAYSNNIEKENSLPYDVFLKVLYTYIIDIYHNTYNNRKKSTPYKLWEKSLKYNPLSLPISNDEINIIMANTLERSISKSGISIDNIYYNDENLNFIRRNNINNLKVQVKRNWDDISYIYVFSNLSKQYIKVLAVDQEYTKGKTLFQHLCILKLASKDAKDKNNREKIYDAEQKIDTYLKEVIQKNKKMRRKDKVLAYQKVSSTTFIEDNKSKENDKDAIPFYEKIQDSEELIDDNEEWNVFSRD